MVLSESNNWKGSLKDLPVYASGNKIVYTITEDAVDGYTTEITGNAAGGFTVTNTHTPAKYEYDDPDGDPEFDELTVTKVWDDDNNRDGKRPESITVHLYANEVDTDKFVILNEDNNWTGYFADLDVYSNGEVIEYTVVEEDVENYKVNYVTNRNSDQTIDGFVITNSYTPAYYDEDNSDGFGPITVKKVWRDGHNQDGFRPEKVTINLFADGTLVDTVTLNETEHQYIVDGTVVDGTWFRTFPDKYPVCRDGGQKIEYTITEDSIDHYEIVDIHGSAEDGFTVTNGHVPETIDLITAEKVWDDADDQDGKRPESVTIRLLKNNIEYARKVVTEEDDWTAEFISLPKYSNGKLITWTVVEDTVSNYNMSLPVGDAQHGFTITNSYTPGKINVTVVKVWDDEDNQDGLRDEDTVVNVELMIVNPDGTLTETGKTLHLSEANDWTAIFTNLDEYSKGEKIVYTVKELDVPDGYESNVIVPHSGEQFVISNTHIPAVYDEIPVNKIWNDDSSTSIYRPESVTVKLYADGEDTGKTVILNDDNDWNGVFEDLPVYKAGEKIEYTVEESDVTAYSGVVTGDPENGFTIENTFDGEIGNLTITKKITGNRASSNDIFTFSITLNDANAELRIPETGLTYTGTIDGRQTISGVISSGDTFTLKGSGWITISGVPAGTIYSVSEIDSQGYIVRAYDASGTITTDGSTASFINSKNYMPNFPIIPDPDPRPDPRPDPDEPDLPDILNTEDHYAYIIGYPDGTVRPEQEITRAEVATIFFRMLTEEARESYWSTSNKFTDVKAGDWYNNAISTLTKTGVINGYPDGTYRPNDPITRAEIVKIAVSFFDFIDDNEHLFLDVRGHWAESYISAAADLGIITGYPDGSFKPDKNITRAEAMTIINNVLGRKPDKDHLLEEMIFWPDNADEDEWYYEAIQEATNSHEYYWNNSDEIRHEIWVRLLPVRDWAALEKSWEANMSHNPGEVLD